jgi:hypothetical protein
MEFTESLRHRCRNPKCRSKLAEPVENERRAFCAKGCFTSYYRHRCLVCEQPFKRKRENQHVCSRPSCKPAFRGNWSKFDPVGYLYTSSTTVAPKTSIKPGIKNGIASGRPWRFVAGPELTPAQLHCATVGGEEAVEAINRTNLRHWREHNAKREQLCLIKPPSACEYRRRLQISQCPEHVIGGPPAPLYVRCLSLTNLLQ